MADISTFVYTAIGSGEMTQASKVKRRFALTTAAGEYPTGGLPLDNNKLGCPTSLDSLIVLEPSAADAYQYFWDKSANTIMVLVDDGTSGVPAEHANATFTSPNQLIVEVVGW